MAPQPHEKTYPQARQDGHNPQVGIVAILFNDRAKMQNRSPMLSKLPSQYVIFAIGAQKCVGGLLRFYAKPAELRDIVSQ
jgi:hypothetical protein